MRAGCQRVMAKFDMGTTKLSGRSAMRASHGQALCSGLRGAGTPVLCGTWGKPSRECRLACL